MVSSGAPTSTHGTSILAPYGMYDLTSQHEDHSRFTCASFNYETHGQLYGTFGHTGHVAFASNFGKAKYWRITQLRRPSDSSLLYSCRSDLRPSLAYGPLTWSTLLSSITLTRCFP